MLNSHHMSVKAAAISPDDRLSFSGSCAKVDDRGICESGDLILWSLETGKELRHWTAHSGWVNTVAFSRDGGELISGGRMAR